VLLHMRQNLVGGDSSAGIGNGEALVFEEVDGDLAREFIGVGGATDGEDAAILARRLRQPHGRLIAQDAQKPRGQVMGESGHLIGAEEPLDHLVGRPVDLAEHGCGGNLACRGLIGQGAGGGAVAADERLEESLDKHFGIHTVAPFHGGMGAASASACATPGWSPPCAPRRAIVGHSGDRALALHRVNAATGVGAGACPPIRIRAAASRGRRYRTRSRAMG